MVKSFKDFIKEGKVDLHNLKLGDKVAHAKHGVGKVVIAPLKTPDVHVQFKSGRKHFHKGNAHELSEYYGHSMYEAHQMDDKVKINRPGHPDHGKNGTIYYTPHDIDSLRGKINGKKETQYAVHLKGMKKGRFNMHHSKHITKVKEDY